MWQWLFYVLLMWAVMLKCTHIFKIYSLDFSWITCGLLLQLVMPRLQNAWVLVFIICPVVFRIPSKLKTTVPFLPYVCHLIRTQSALLSITSVFKDVSQNLMDNLLKACAGTCWRINIVVILTWFNFWISILYFLTGW